MPKLWERFKEIHQAARRKAALEKTEQNDRKLAATPEKTVWLVVGLGNFGPEYADTRHNCGFRALDQLAELLSAAPDSLISQPRHRFKGVTREANYGRARLILLWPYTYMNNSGESIAEALAWYKLREDRLIVIYDDCDLAPGAIRIRQKGSAGTHNGMKSVLIYTETDEFARIRVGIGRKPAEYNMIDFVLGRPGPEDKPLLAQAERRAAEAALSIIEHGCERTMSSFNSPHGDAGMSSASGSNSVSNSTGSSACQHAAKDEAANVEAGKHADKDATAAATAEAGKDAANTADSAPRQGETT